MRGNGASFGIVTEFIVRLHDMPNDGIIHGGPILWPVDKAKEVMTSWMGRIARPDRRDTGNASVCVHALPGWSSSVRCRPVDCR